MSTPTIRILHFVPRRADFDGQLREQFIPVLRSQAGLLDLVAGRHGPDERGPRIVVSVWAPDAVVAIPPWSDRGVLDVAGRLEPDEGRLEVLPVRVQVHGDRTDPPRVLRVFRGRVRIGELDRYLHEVEAGARSDVAAGHGPLALYLGSDPDTPDAFATISTWREWAVVEAATGGDIHQPVATRHPERLVESDVTHFEVIEL
jgi:hypothetical protein